jgi:hypothetical protein
MNSTSSASRKFTPIVETILSSRSALPASRMFASGGSCERSEGTMSLSIFASMSSSDSVGGGSIVSVTVR